MTKTLLKPGVVAHTFNPSTWEAEAGGTMSWRLAWSTGQPGIHRKTKKRFFAYSDINQL